VLQVPEKVRGQKVRCGQCGKNFIVPSTVTATQASISKPGVSTEKNAG